MFKLLASHAQHKIHGNCGWLLKYSYISTSHWALAGYTMQIFAYQQALQPARILSKKPRSRPRSDAEDALTMHSHIHTTVISLLVETVACLFSLLPRSRFKAISALRRLLFFFPPSPIPCWLFWSSSEIISERLSPAGLILVSRQFRVAD